MSTIDINGAEDPATTESTISHDDIEIRTLHHADEMVGVGDMFRQVWGSSTELVSIEILMAISHSGGYVSGAYGTRHGDEQILGASVALLARHLGAPALHSHITGLLPGARHSGLGRAMKQHQRAWAAENGIEWIVWTFDPLVRRNAWFNIAVLGAEAHEYLPSFYGTMSDSINGGDDSDRLLMAWRVDGASSRPADTSAERLLVPTPDDIVNLRRTDPAAAVEWRRDTRRALQGALERGDRVVGFSTDGNYEIEVAEIEVAEIEVAEIEVTQ